MEGTSDADGAVAIVGLACRLPAGVSSPEDLWRLLLDGRELPRRMPHERVGGSVFSPGLPVEPPGVYFEADDLTGLDIGFFALSPREAADIDPQQRLLMELTWEACEHAGLPPESMSGPVGVFVAQWSADFGQRTNDGPATLYELMGRGRHASSGRLSHLFHFDGPSMTIDTACSSSLVAVHQAVAAIRAGDCETAVVAAANVIMDGRITTGFDDAGMLSGDGRCRFGDASADGFGRAEGAAAIVLRRLDRARADADRILAVVEASGLSNDGGEKRSLAAPSAVGQRLAAERAWRRAPIALSDAAYIEAHGTGTVSGDSTEIQALNAAFAAMPPGIASSKTEPCPVGSIKSNVGHTESAAGLFGLIKAVLMLQHRLIPPTLHVERPIPAFDDPDARLRLTTETEPLRGERPRIGVAGFGISGTNAHVVVAAPNADDDRAEPGPSGICILPLSARSAPALKARAGALARRIAVDHATFDAIAATCRNRRSHLDHRAAVISSDPVTAIAALDALADGIDHDALVTGRVGTDMSVPGPGADQRAMGRAFVAGVVTANDLGWVGTVTPVGLPSYPWQRLRTWPSDQPAPNADRQPGSQLPAVANRPNEHVWERVWSAEALVSLLSDPTGVADIVTAAAKEMHDGGWEATVALATSSTSRIASRADGPAPAARTQLLVVDGPHPRFELFLGSGAGWTAVADGTLERLDGYPLPAMIGSALEGMALRRRQSWLAKRVAEQAAIALGRPPSAPLDHHKTLGVLGLDVPSLPTLGARLNALIGNNLAATTIDVETTIDELAERLLVVHGKGDEAPGTSDSPLHPGSGSTDTQAGDAAPVAATDELARRLAAMLDEPPATAPVSD